MNRYARPELLEQLLREHGAALQLFAAQWSETPEDCLQEGLLRLVRQPVTPDNALAWLYRVVRNLAISQQRSVHRRRQREQAAARQQPWFVADHGQALDGDELAAALRLLDDAMREVIVARIWGGLRFEEIADVVGCSTSTAHRRYEAGLSALRGRLGVKWTSKKETPIP